MASRSRKKTTGRRAPVVGRRDESDRLATDDARTIGALLHEATESLRQAGIPEPDRLVLNTWAALADVAPGAAWLRRGEPSPSGEFLHHFREAIARQAAGEPVQYVVERAGFRLLDLLVDRRVLIPRSETEGLVDHVLEFGRTHGWGVAVDIGTGSGVIALSLATEGSFERVIATDVSPEALEVARFNLARVAPVTPVEFRQGSFLEPLSGVTADVIVSNPPYVSSAELDGLPAMVRDFEPHLALDGGPGGLGPTAVLLRDAARHLTPGGLLALEIDSSRGAQTLDLARAGGWRGRVLPDAAGRDRYLLATREPD